MPEEDESRVNGADSNTELPATGEPATGATALQRQLDGIAAERGLDRAQVTTGAPLGNMPGVTPTAFAAIAGILDVLIDADGRAEATPSTEEDGT